MISARQINTSPRLLACLVDEDDTNDADPPDAESHEDETGSGDAPTATDHGGDGLGPDLAEDLVPLLPAARDELRREGSTVSRDTLAVRLRRNGTPIRNTRISDLLAVLKTETRSLNGSRPKAPV